MPSGIYSKIFLHAVWHVKGDEPLITTEIEKLIHACLKNKFERVGSALLFQTGGTENHLHVAFKILPSMNIAKLIGELKGISSFEVNHTNPNRYFQWQEGYGVVSFKEKDLSFISNYIVNQKEHHKPNKIIPELEVISD